MQKHIRHIPLVLLFAFALFTAIWGLDLGYHWDEEVTTRSITHTIETGVILPFVYLYGGVLYDLALISFVPDAIHVALSPPPAEQDSANATLSGWKLNRIQATLTTLAEGQTYLLRTRGLFAFLSLLCIVWVYFTIYGWHRNISIAWCGAAFVGLSWEVAYHARWVTGDTLMMSFGALALLGLERVLHGQSRQRWLTLAAIAAGLATGCKWTAGILLVPVFQTIYFSCDRNSRHRFPWREWYRVSVIFAVTFLITTPGILLDPMRAADGILFNMGIYSAGHREHTISSGLPHLSRILEYYSLALFSPYWFGALLVFVLVLVGAYAVWQSDRQMAWLLLTIPVFYTIYFSLQRVMFVRNYLITVPFLAILAAAGVRQLWLWVQQWAWLKGTIAACLVIVLVVNAVWLVWSSNTVNKRYENRALYIHQLADFVRDRPRDSFVFSPRVSGELQMLGLQAPSNGNRGKRYAAFYQTEVTDCLQWDATQRNYTEAWFGPYEVNFNYYPTWAGEDRIVVLAAELPAAIHAVTGASAPPQQLQKERTGEGLLQ